MLLMIDGLLMTLQKPKEVGNFLGAWWDSSPPTEWFAETYPDLSFMALVRWVNGGFRVQKPPNISALRSMQNDNDRVHQHEKMFILTLYTQKVNVRYARGNLAVSESCPSPEALHCHTATAIGDWA